MRWPKFFWHREIIHDDPHAPSSRPLNIADIRKKYHETVKEGKRREARSAAK
jgi:hypothetical protein